jgi:hypothetical protein
MRYNHHKKIYFEFYFIFGADFEFYLFCNIILILNINIQIKRIFTR